MPDQCFATLGTDEDASVLVCQSPIVTKPWVIVQLGLCLLKKIFVNYGWVLALCDNHLVIVHEESSDPSLSVLNGDNIPSTIVDYLTDIVLISQDRGYGILLPSVIKGCLDS